MASTRVQRAVLIARIGSMLLAVMAVAIGVAHPYPDASSQSTSFSYMMVAMWLHITWGALELLLQLAYRTMGLGPIPNVLLGVLIIVNMVLMCCTWGIASAAVSVALFARYYRLCMPMIGCARFLVNAILALVVGTLSAITGFGTLWLLGSRFRPAID